MKYNFYIILIVAFFVNMQNGFTQPYNSTGETLNLALLAKTPQKIKLSQRSFMSLPESYSLEKYCPTPGNQGHFGTCTAWASAYGVATILYAKTHNITDQAMINKYAFSPSFLYNLIKNSTDESCKEGSSTIDALNKLTELGDALLTTVPYGCNVYVSDAARAEAANYKINDGIVLFAARGLFEADKFYKPAEEAIELVKKSLTEGSPVSISIRLPESFLYKTAVLKLVLTENISDSKWQHNIHAMCVIGYNDKIEGGAFRVLNNWGSNWNDNGLI